MRKINGKLFFALLLGTLVLTGSVFAVHHFQYQRIGKAVLFQAKRAEESGRSLDQARYLQRYLEFNQRDHDETARLAKLWASSDEFPAGSKQRLASINLMDQVLVFRDDPELRRLLIRTAIQIGGQSQIKKAREHIEKLLPKREFDMRLAADKAFRDKATPLPENLTREDKDSGELESAWAMILEDDKRTVDAIHAYRLAVRHAPEMQTNYMRLAYLLRRENETDLDRRKKNTDEADFIMDELVKKNDASHESYLARWRYRRDFDLMSLRENLERGRIALEAAAEDVVAAIKRRPESVEVLLAAADLERLRGRVEGDDGSKSEARRREAIREHRDKAFTFLKRGLEIVSRNAGATTEYGKFQLLWHKGNLLLDDLDARRAEREDSQPDAEAVSLRAEIASVVEQVRKAQIRGAGEYMRGRLLIDEKQWAEAARLFEQATAHLAASQPELACQADLYLGACYEKLEEHAQMYAAYRRVLTRDSNSVQAKLGLAQAQWLQGQLEPALQTYEGLMKEKQIPPRGWLDIARLELQRQMLAEKPNWEAVERPLRLSKKQNPKAIVEVTLLEAEVLVRKNKPEEARALLEAERIRDPKQVEIHAALADLALRDKQADKAASILDKARRAVGDRAGLRLAQARLLAATQGKKANVAIAKLAEDRDKLEPVEQARLLSGLADVLFRNEDLATARGLWQTLAKLPNQKSNLRLRLLLFDLAMRDSDENGMRAMLDDIKVVEQDTGLYHRYGEALYLIWKARRTNEVTTAASELAKATAQLDRVLNQRASWAPVFIARADIAELRGNPEDAIKNLREAMRSGDTSPTTVRRLVVLLNNKGEESQADDLLKHAKPAMRAHSDLGRLGIAQAIRNGNYQSALELTRTVVREDSNDPRDLVFRGQVHAAAGKVPEALKLFDQAIAAAPADPVAYVAKVQLLIDQKKKDEALTVIAAMKKGVPADKSSLSLGRCYDLVNQPKDAIAAYEQASKGGEGAMIRAVASAHMNAGRPMMAEPLLRKLAREEVKANSGDVAWSRRALAMLLSAGTDFERFREALDLVGLRLDSNGRLPTGKRETDEEPTDTLRARARVLASQTQKQFRTEAIRLLEVLKRRSALMPDDRFVLAILYDQDGERSKSRDNLSNLVTERRTANPQYLAQYATLLIGQKSEHESAERFIGMIEELEKQREVGPNGFASVDLRARLLEAKGKGDEGLALLKKHTARKGAKPEEVLLVLGSLSRQKRFDEAFTLCETTWKEGKCAPEVMGAFTVSLMRFMPKATDAQVRGIEERLSAALKQKPDNVALRMQLADLYDKRGRYDDAAEQYALVLTKQENNVVAHNNLAWMLAMRSGDANKALDHIEKAIKGMGRRADLLDTRAMVYLALNEPGKAIADLNEAVQDGPTPTRLYHLARAYHENRDPSKARDFLQKAKDKGLELAKLHPVEVEVAKKLLAEYGMN